MADTYITGTGQYITNVHTMTEDCLEFGCVMHNPTDPNPTWATHWRDDRALMERICPCGVGHPDKDGIEYVRRTFGEARAAAEAIHGCCGCACGANAVVIVVPETPEPVIVAAEPETVTPEPEPEPEVPSVDAPVDDEDEAF